MNRILNPGLARILRSRVHRPLSGRLAVLEIASMSTGAAVEVPAMYRARGEDLFRIDVGDPESKRWWRMLRGPRALYIWLHGVRRDAVGVAVEQHGRVSIVIHLEAPGETDRWLNRHAGRHHRRSVDRRRSAVGRVR